MNQIINLSKFTKHLTFKHRNFLNKLTNIFANIKALQFIRIIFLTFSTIYL